MEEVITLLMMDYKRLKGLRLKEEPEAIDANERRKYENLSLQVMKNAIYRSHVRPDEAITEISCLNTDLDTLVFRTQASRGFESVEIKNLGYQLRDGVYVQRS